MKNNKEEKFLSLALREVEFLKEAENLSYKELADFLIQEVWGDENFNEFGTLKCAVLDRVINILFELHEKEKIAIDNYVKSKIKN